ncbi:hypothetical protein LCGC14_2273720 [marine sediment metagenome]|uniref:Uncharacterized protein n=1 Tax=marine sediment metagenome TaxID=412755 RepID=A0A0F9F8R3_9ZZZZ
MKALLDLLTERQRQSGMWSADHDDGHTSQDWDRFIRCRLDEFYSDNPGGGTTPERRRRELMIHIAALALAALEADDRGGLAMRT